MSQVFKIGPTEFDIESETEPMEGLDSFEPTSEMMDSNNSAVKPQMVIPGGRQKMGESVSLVPDTMGAVGRESIMSPLNTRVYFCTREGSWWHNIKLGKFWKAMVGRDVAAFDPRVIYDHKTSRWIFVSVADPDTNPSLFIAVSREEDPRKGKWLGLCIKSETLDNGTFFDFPQLGVSGDKIVVTAVIQSRTKAENSGSAIVYVFNKNDFIKKDFDKIHYCSFKDIAGMNVSSPSVDVKAESNNVYLVESRHSSEIQGSDLSRLELHEITGLPTKSGSTVRIKPCGYSYPNEDLGDWKKESIVPNSLSQKGANGVHGGDHRIQSVVHTSNALWCVHTVFVTGNQKATVQWWKLNTNGDVLIMNRLHIDREYAYPSIAVNSKDVAVIGMSSFKSDRYPSAAFAYWKTGLDNFIVELDYQSGNATHKQSYKDKYRWGDYSATVLDPKDSDTFWTLQEYTYSSSKWGTVWAKLKIKK